MISRNVRSWLRLIVVALMLVPLAILARMCASETLTEVVQRKGARALQRFERRD